MIRERRHHTHHAIRRARKHRMRLAWSVWLVAAVFTLFQFFLQLSSGEIISGLMQSFALTAFGGGVLASTYYYVYFFLQAPAGMVVDRYGPRLILSAGAAVVAIGCVIFGSAKLMLVAVLGRILMGLGASFAFVGCLNLISKWFPMRRFAFMTGIVEMVGMAGAIIGNLWIASVVEKLGWRTCMMAAGILAAVITIFLIVAVRNAPRRKTPQTVLSQMDLWQGVKRLLVQPVVWINGLYCGLLFSVITVFAALWGIPFLQQAHHITLFQSTAVMSVLYFGTGIGSPIAGWIDARTYCRRFLCVGGALGAAACLFVVIFWVQLSLWIVVILLLLTGLLISSYVLTFAVANEVAIPANRATCIGFTNMLCVMTAPILQPLVGFLMNYFNEHGVHNNVLHYSLWHFELAISIVPISVAIAAILGLFLPNCKRPTR